MKLVFKVYYFPGITEYKSDRCALIKVNVEISFSLGIQTFLGNPKLPQTLIKFSDFIFVVGGVKLRNLVYKNIIIDSGTRVFFLTF